WRCRGNNKAWITVPRSVRALVPSGERRRGIVSESRVRVDHETEEAPVNDGEVGEADVVGEFDEPEEPGASGELGEAGEAGDGAADAAATADDPTAVADDVEAVAGDDEQAADGADEPDPVAQYTDELRRLPGEWYVVHSYAGYE